MAETMTTQEVLKPKAVLKPKVKEGPFDITKKVKVTATDKAPFHKEGQSIEVAPLVAEKMKLNGWAK